MTTAISAGGITASVTTVHTLVLGSGAAGLNAALQLKLAGIDDLMIVSEGLQMGTSINTGSDKQTYYKLGLYGNEPDSPVKLAESLFAGGAMDGDLALTEAALSARAFLNLVGLGVRFPQDSFGQFVGYKTDHDPLQRATSLGPYTSRDMCRSLIQEVRRHAIPICENRVAVALLTVDDERGGKRAAGIIAVATERGEDDCFEIYRAENVVFAVGGPGGLYHTSVYPAVHTGAIGLALQAGALAKSLPESQYGMASIKFRWNVSGTYMQVLPRFISTAADGVSDEREFLQPYFSSAGELNSMVFLKGYQWPFDPRKAAGGSSLIDILVHIETVLLGRRVFLDFRRNPSGLDFTTLTDEARTYLDRSGALFGSPIERLAKMNPAAIRLYEDHGIHLVAEPLEIAVCAQHNNGGLAANHWWESTNISHLFPAGEVNGSHGVYRPGGSALNAGQVAGFRIADYIAARYREATLDSDRFTAAAAAGLEKFGRQLRRSSGAAPAWSGPRRELQRRMTSAAAHIRRADDLRLAVAEAWEQYRKMETETIDFDQASDLAEMLRNRQLCFAHAVYLEAVLAAVESGVGSRGSALVLTSDGQAIHPALGPEWRFQPEAPEFREQVLETVVGDDGKVVNRRRARRPIPSCDGWFENAWADYRNGNIYN